MKKKILRYTLPFLCVGLLAACGSEEPGSDRGRMPEPTEKQGPDGGNSGNTDPGVDLTVPENEILLVSRSTNGAWGYADSGYFIDTNGDVYGFDFSQMGYRMYTHYGMDFYDKLMLIRENVPSKINIGEDMVNKIYELGEEIDPGAGFDSQNMACDMGQRTIYYYDADTGDLIRCISHGDNEELPKDRNARKLANLVENDLTLSGIPYTELYTEGDIYMDNIHCGYQDAMEGKYYLPNAADLRAFAAMTGIAADHILDGMDEYEPENYCYLVEIRNVSSTGYDLKADAVIRNNNDCRFLMSPDSVTPASGDTVGMAMDGFCFVAAYPVLYDPTELGSDWTMAEDILYEGLDGRFTFTSPGPDVFVDYGKTVVIENVLLTDEDGNEYGTGSLVVDYDTAFSEDCEMEFFGGYEDGQMPIEWIWRSIDMEGEEYVDQGMPLTGVFEVELSAGHVDYFCGSYWWD